MIKLGHFFYTRNLLGPVVPAWSHRVEERIILCHNHCEQRDYSDIK